MTRRLAIIVLILVLLATGVLAQTKEPTVGAIQGLVFTIDPDGTRSVVPGTKISLDGSSHFEAESDAQGQFAFGSVPPGNYTVTANAPGLVASATVAVIAGSASQAPLEMKVAAVAESATVTATTEQVDTKESSGSTTIGESLVEHMPNQGERFEDLLPLVPGVVRGPSGRINMKGARASENGSLVNSADVTDPATGEAAISLPIDVVSSVQVLSTPYNPEFGKFTGAVSNVETRTGDFNKFRISAQNFLPRLRRVDGSIMGIAAVSPRVTFSGPIVKDRVAFTESLQYRYERNPVYSLPTPQRDTKSEKFDSYTQIDINISKSQTATASFAVFPEKFDYYGLNTFTPQASTPDFHESGYQAYLQHRYVTDSGDLLTSQISYKSLGADFSHGPVRPTNCSQKRPRADFLIVNIAILLEPSGKRFSDHTLISSLGPIS